jgi:hypothetical protein
MACTPQLAVWRGGRVRALKPAPLWAAAAAAAGGGGGGGGGGRATGNCDKGAEYEVLDAAFDPADGRTLRLQLQRGCA